ncbi:flavodoxin reductase [Algoriphagus sp. A40]|nr:flavodoxin reductase [Algoriphagus sp. A40]
MEKHILKVKSIQKITPDVLRITTDKPEAIDFEPGQATELSIKKSGWEAEKRPFTFSSLPAEKSLEFTIKTYPDHKGMTKELLELENNDELVAHEVFGAIRYKGKGVFIAGGAGITPFISIFRDLKAKNEIGKNQLIFANKTKADIILEKEFEALLGDAFINVLSEENAIGYHYGVITREFLETYITDFRQQFYLCGPPPMIKAVEQQLSELGVDEKLITKEKI